MKPIFGQAYADAYDRLYTEKDYDGETEILSTIFEKYSPHPVKSVLDLGCGTGNHAVRLAARGLRVVGVDQSPDMLRVAEEKARERRVPVRFCQSDLRELSLPERFDAVVMMFAVLGYQLENGDALNALRTARRHVHSDGTLVFDVWYGPAVVAQRPGDRIRMIDTDGVKLLRTASSKMHTQQQICTVEYHVWRMKSGRILQESNETHRMRYFFPRELDLLLEMSGFQLLRLGAFPELGRDPDETTWNAVIVAGAGVRPSSGPIGEVDDMWTVGRGAAVRVISRDSRTRSRI